MKHHLLISTFIDSLVYFNNKILSLEESFIRKLSTFTFSNCSFYDVDLNTLNAKLSHLKNLYKDKNLHVKSKYISQKITKSEKVGKNEFFGQGLDIRQDLSL